VAQNAGVAAGGRWTDQVSLGVLASSVPRDVIDDAVSAAGRSARRSDGKLPPHVMVYFAMAMALFAEDDYEEVAARLAGTLSAWGCWDARWGPPTSGGITRARERLGFEPLRDIFAQVAVPVADQLTRSAFLGPWRLMSIDGFEWDAPDTPGNATAYDRRPVQVLRADLLLRLPLQPVPAQVHRDRLPQPWPPASPAAPPPQPAAPAAAPPRSRVRESPHSRHSAASRSPAAADSRRRTTVAVCNSAPTLSIAADPGVRLETISASRASAVAD